MPAFEANQAYVAKDAAANDDGKEIELLHYVYGQADAIRNSPSGVLRAIDEYGRTRRFLMNVGAHKGRIVTDLIAETKPKVMVELGGYVGYSAVLFGHAVRKVGGERYWSLERNPEFAAVARSLVDLAGLSDIVRIVVGPCAESLRRLDDEGALRHIDLLFLDHHKPAYLPDLRLAEDLHMIGKGSVLAADNVIKPGNPPYLEYVRAGYDEKLTGLLKRAAEGGGLVKWSFANGCGNSKYMVRPSGAGLGSEAMGNPSLVYTSTLVKSFEPTGDEVSAAMMPSALNMC
ncbi:MAG: hypothetical protein M1832_001572 [Thelocarpon impressellum]|nr:MAG: hypothetical protein M1832_001572 [Thelocarpon impressellum]